MLGEAFSGHGLLRAPLMLKNGLGHPVTLALPIVPALALLPSLSIPTVPPLFKPFWSVPTLSMGSSGVCDELWAADRDWASLRRWGTRGYLP